MPVLQFRTHFGLIILSSLTCLFCFLLIVSVIFVTLFSVEVDSISDNDFSVISSHHSLGNE